MTTPTTGMISMFQAATEAKLNVMTGAPIDHAEIRKLCNKRTGQISMDDLHNRTYGIGKGYMLTEFVAVTMAEVELIASNTIVISGAGSSPVQLLIVSDNTLGVEYNVNDAGWVSSSMPGQIKDDDTLQLRLTAAASSTYVTQARYGTQTRQWDVSTTIFSEVELSAEAPFGPMCYMAPSGFFAHCPARMSGSLFVPFVQYRDPNGGLMWDISLPAGKSTHRTAIDSSGNLYILRVGSSSVASCALSKYSPAGAFMWNVHIGGSGGSITNMALAGDSIVLSGSVPGASALVCVTSSGAISWAKTLPSGSTFRNVIGDDSGNIYATLSYELTRSDSVLGLLKFSSSGTLLWKAGLNRAGTNDTADDNALVLDGAGNLYLANSWHNIGSNSQYLAKYSTYGALTWVAHTAFEEVTNLYANSVGAYVSGHGASGTYNTTTFRYSADGGAVSGIAEIPNMNAIFASKVGGTQAVVSNTTLYRGGLDAHMTAFFGSLPGAGYGLPAAYTLPIAPSALTVTSTPAALVSF